MPVLLYSFPKAPPDRMRFLKVRQVRTAAVAGAVVAAVAVAADLAKAMILRKVAEMSRIPDWKLLLRMPSRSMPVLLRHYPAWLQRPPRLSGL